MATVFALVTPLIGGSAADVAGALVHVDLTGIPYPGVRTGAPKGGCEPGFVPELPHTRHVGWTGARRYSRL
jgi:hypothetical protein